jgi:hypothetical protein
MWMRLAIVLIVELFWQVGVAESGAERNKSVNKQPGRHASKPRLHSSDS